MKQYFVLGTYTEDILFGTGEVFHGKGKGVSICEFEDGHIRLIGTLPVRNPSFLCINEGKQKIYAVNEMKEYKGIFGGGITQIAYENNGKMTAEQDFPTKGTDPCHVALAPDGNFLSVANFASGAVTIFELDKDGNLVREGCLYQHQGHSIHPVRQKGPHAHSTIFAPDCRKMYVPDLGIDELALYTWEERSADCVREPGIKILAGSGPRFGEFDCEGKNFYLIHEISSQVRHYSYQNGILEEREIASTLPKGFKGDNICADLHITPDGKWLYASNRGHDSLACFRLEKDGTMKFAGQYSCGGRTPRNFAIDPLGKYLLVGNQDSDQIVVFEIRDRGELSEVSRYSCGSPVCIRFFSDFR